MGHLNIEIKARCANPQRIRERLLAKAVKFCGVDQQIDVKRCRNRWKRNDHGRIKGREQSRADW